VPQLDTTSALITALASAGIGFGLAFFLLGILNKRFERKSQRVLAMIAMVSFGVGLSGVLNEVIGFPLQGLNIRWEKVVTFVIANTLFIPAIFVGIAFAIRGKTVAQTALVETPNIAIEQKRKSWQQPVYGFAAAGTAISIALLYAAIQPTIFETYSFVKDSSQCTERLNPQPISLIKFGVKPLSAEVVAIVKFTTNEEKRVASFKECKIFNEQNWSCGGELKQTAGNRGFYTEGLIEMIDGNIKYTPSTLPIDIEFRDCGTIYKRASILSVFTF